MWYKIVRMQNGRSVGCRPQWLCLLLSGMFKQKHFKGCIFVEMYDDKKIVKLGMWYNIVLKTSN